jgi:hypothetical protein
MKKRPDASNTRKQPMRSAHPLAVLTQMFQTALAHQNNFICHPHTPNLMRAAAPPEKSAESLIQAGSLSRQ